MNAPRAISVRGLKKVYTRSGCPELVAVNGISFEVSAGECFGLLGPNGAGKSTTIKCLTGFYSATEGQVEILGVNVHRNPREARGSLGVCSQEDSLDTDFHVLDQMVQFGAYFGIGRKQAKARSLALLDRFGLLDKKNDAVESLSGGMRRRLQVARSLINDPKILVLDEPTTGLDPEVRRALWDIIRVVREQGAAILLSTHYMDEAERLCDRVAILHQGKILACGGPRELIADSMGTSEVSEELRPGVSIQRAPNLEDVYLKITGNRLGVGGGGASV